MDQLSKRLKLAEQSWKQDKGCSDCSQKITGLATSCSVIMATFNEGTNLTNTIRACWDTNGVDEIVIVDNASTDNTFEELNRIRQDTASKKSVIKHMGLPPITKISLSDSIGVHRGLNLAASFATSEVILVYSGHMNCSGQKLKQLATEAMDREAIVQAYSRGMSLDSRMSCWGSQWVEDENKIFDLKWNTRIPKEEYTTIDGLMGACYAIPRTIWDKLGGFCNFAGTWGFLEGFLSFKANIMNIPIFVSRDIFARHKYKSKNENIIPASEIWQSRLACFKIMLEDSTWETLLPLLILRAGTYFSEEFLNNPELLKEHKRIQSLRQISDEEFFSLKVPKLWEVIERLKHVA